MKWKILFVLFFPQPLLNNLNKSNKENKILKFYKVILPKFSFSFLLKTQYQKQ